MSHYRKVLETALEAAWLRTCGESGKPGKWFIPGGFVPVISDGEVEVSLYPTYAIGAEHGEPRGWSMHYQEAANRAEAWQWSFGVGWDDLPDEMWGPLEDLGGCLDERSVVFHALGDHQVKPEVPQPVVDAYEALERACAS